jgi:hypothetical protein
MISLAKSALTLDDVVLPADTIRVAMTMALVVIVGPLGRFAGVTMALVVIVVIVFLLVFFEQGLEAFVVMDVLFLFPVVVTGVGVRCR